MRIIYCLQNLQVEKVFQKKGIIKKDDLIIRTNEELKFEKVEQFNPDFIMFPHWSYKVEEKIISEFTCICFHSAPLPYGRGGSPIQNMIKRGFKQTELCSLIMTNEFDAGPILLRTNFMLDGNLDKILNRMYSLSADQIKKIKSENLKPKQQVGDIVNFKRLSEEDNELKLDRSNSEIYDQIRMLDSIYYPNSYLKHEDKIIEFFDAKYIDGVVEAKIKIKKND